MRKKIVAGNWKMNKTLEEGLALASEVVNMVKDEVKKETTSFTGANRGHYNEKKLECFFEMTEHCC